MKWPQATPLKYVYALRSKAGEVRYVGLTRSPNQRLRTHSWPLTPLGIWVRSESPDLIVLEAVGVTRKPGRRERHWIEHYRSAGADLFNIWPRQGAA